jgi:hypothetical protein
MNGDVDVSCIYRVVVVQSIVKMSVAELSDISDGHRLVFAVQIGLEREAVTVALDGYVRISLWLPSRISHVHLLTEKYAIFQLIFMNKAWKRMLPKVCSQ